MPDNHTPPNRCFNWNKEGHPLDRQKGETTISNTALNLYYGMGIKRSLRGLARMFERMFQDGQVVPTRRIGTIKGWASFYKWEERLRSADSLAAGEERIKWEERRLERWALDWESGSRLRELGMSLLAKSPDFVKERVEIIKPVNPADPIVERHYLSMDPKIMVAILEMASKLQAAAGPPVIDAQTVVNVDYSKLTRSQLERLRDGEEVMSVLSNPGQEGQG